MAAERVSDRPEACRAGELLGLQALEPALGLDRGRIEGQGTAIIVGGCGVIAEPLLRQTTVEIGQREAPIEFDGPGEVSNRARTSCGDGGRREAKPLKRARAA